MDPRDKVFSLRAICEDGQKIPVDYSISLFELIMSILKLEEGKLCFCYISLLLWSIGYTDVKDPAWRDTLCFQIPSTKQPQNNNSEIDVDEVHELDLRPVTNHAGGKLSWCNGVITYFPIYGGIRYVDVSRIRFVKNSQGRSLWRFSVVDMTRFSGGKHLETESCLRKPTTITIGKWDP